MPQTLRGLVRLPTKDVQHDVASMLRYRVESQVNEHHQILLTVEILSPCTVHVRLALEGAVEGRTHMVVDDKGDMCVNGNDVASVNQHRRPQNKPTISFKEFHDEMSDGNIKVVIFTKDDLRIEIHDCKRETLVFADSAVDSYQVDVETDSFRHTVKRLTDSERYFGFGEVAGRLNKAGMRLRVDAKDSMGYDAETTDPLYKHWPYGLTVDPVAVHGSCYGLLYDSMRRSTFDLGKEISAFRGKYRYFETRAWKEGLDYYVMVGANPPAVSQALVDLIGAAVVPPRWSLGYLGSSMAYTESENAMDRLESFLVKLQDHEIPCDGFHLSSGYTTDPQGRRCVFTWNNRRVPDPKLMFARFNQRSINVIANVKPWLLKEHPSFGAVRELGGYFVDPQTQLPSFGKFWVGDAGTSGLGSYLDFSNQAAFQWWKDQAKTTLLDLGCRALWNDNNEYEVDDGKVIDSTGKTVEAAGRALYTQLMARASYEALKEQLNEDDILVVSRSGSVGTHRYAAQTWSGDNSTSWKTMRFNVAMCLGLGLCGWVGSGPDIGGFAGEKPSPEMLLRWIQCGALMPRFSIHSSVWKTSTNTSEILTRKTGEVEEPATTNEPWMFPECLGAIRQCIRLRYRCKRFLHSLYLKARRSGAPVARPLFYHYPNDLNTFEEDFSFMLGEDVLVAPIMYPGIINHDVYLPKGDDWILLRDTGRHELFNGGESHSISFPSFEDSHIITALEFAGIPLFIRVGGGVVLDSKAGFRGCGYEPILDEMTVILAASRAMPSAAMEWEEADMGVWKVTLKDTTMTLKLLSEGKSTEAKRSKRDPRRVFVTVVFDDGLVVERPLMETMS